MKNSTSNSRAANAAGAADAPETGAAGVPAEYDDFAAEQGLDAAEEQADVGDQRRGFSHTVTTGRAFLNAVKELPNGGFVFELCLLSGGQDDKAHRIYGSFYAAKRLHRWAGSQVGIEYEQGTVCNVEILNLRADPSHGREGKIFENYRGLLVRLAFG